MRRANVRSGWEANIVRPLPMWQLFGIVMKPSISKERLAKLAPWLPVFGPALFTAYLYFSRWPVIWATAFTDWLVLVFAVAIGALGVALLPTREWVRMALVSIYVPVMGVALFIWTLAFLCAVFELCL